MNLLKKFMAYIKTNKIFVIFYSILVLMGISAIIFTYNNYQYYDETIAKVTDTSEEHVETITITYGYTEEIYKQVIKANILNGEDKGEVITILNEYHKGQAYDQKYQIGDEIFVSVHKDDGEVKDAYIDGLKRDKYIVILIVALILTITLVGHLKGFLSVISVVLNIIIFNVLLHIHNSGVSLVLLSFIGAVIFCIVCLSLVSGINKKTLAAIISSISGVLITMLITFIVIKLTDYEGIRFEQMELLSGSYKAVFISELILCGLGAIMDISISISSSLNELIEKDEKISVATLKKSGFTIGKDIMSTMINVLFFTYICTAIPNLSVYFRNGIEINFLVSEFISMEMARALICAIGIVVTIPISIYISTFIYKRRIK